MAERDPLKDPHAGDRIEHEDGGTMYVRGRSQKLVLVGRIPRGSLGINRWMRLTTFAKVARGVFYAAK